MLALIFNPLKGVCSLQQPKQSVPALEGWDLLPQLYQQSPHTLASIYLNMQVTIHTDALVYLNSVLSFFFKHFNNMQIATIISEINVSPLYHDLT